MKLSNIVGPDTFIPPEWDRDIANIHADSRDVSSGDLFIARAGEGEHGEKYIQSAIENGAVAVMAIVSEGAFSFRCTAEGIPVFSVPEENGQQLTWLKKRYLGVARTKLIGVTGTNGKSSVTQYVAQLLSALNESCGVLGTLGNGVWPDLQATRNTTPDICLTYQYLHAMQSTGTHYAALEVSSHGLQQNRVAGLSFDVAVLTNVSQDHLDYHGTMDSYFAAKSKLFLDGCCRVAVVNIDDEYGVKLWHNKQLPSGSISVGNEATPADFRYANIKMSAEGMTAELMTPWGQASLNLALLGAFNVANVAAAIAALTLQGFDFKALVKAARKLQPVDGRMALYVNDTLPKAVVDFAHTPDALKNVLVAIKPLASRVSLVFGCGGDRDRSKRPLMAEVANMADNVWVADDNPRSESPEQIFADIAQHENTQTFTFQHDRTTAIGAAIAATPKDGIVIIAGKGHENYQEINGQRLDYSDEEVLLSAGYQKAGSTDAGDHHAA